MHAIRLVEDDHLPDGLDWLFVTEGDDRFIFYRASVLAEDPEAGARILAESWAAYRALVADDRPPGSRLRVAS